MKSLEDIGRLAGLMFPQRSVSAAYLSSFPLPHIAWKGPCYQIYSISSTLLLICSIIRLLNSLIPDSSLFCLEPMEINKQFNELLMKRLECLSPTLPNIRNIMAPDFYNLKIGLNQGWEGKVIMDFFWFILHTSGNYRLIMNWYSSMLCVCMCEWEKVGMCNICSGFAFSNK